jgi:hypothetical protein
MAARADLEAMRKDARPIQNGGGERALRRIECEKRQNMLRSQMIFFG